jgi:hypothetical protein
VKNGAKVQKIFACIAFGTNALKNDEVLETVFK